MRRRAARAVTMAALMAVGGLSLATPARAGNGGAGLPCGTTITQSTVLQGNIGPCTAEGIIIGADSITLDLNGYRIFGIPAPGDRAGVYLLNRSAVIVQNGEVSDFDMGVAIEGGSRNVVRRMNAHDNIGGTGGTGGDGIAILSSRNNRVESSRTVNNAPYSGVGIYSRIDSNHPRATAGAATGNVVDNNYIVDNNIGRNRVNTTDTDNDGIRMENDGAFNTLSNNTVVNSGLDGIALFADTFDNIVRGNNVSRNGFYRTTARRGSGIIVFTRAARNLVENNQVTRNADSGIDIRPPLFGFPGATDNRILNNTAVGNGALPFIPSPVFGESFDLKDGNLNCDNNVWFANRYRTFNQPCVTNGGQQV